MSTESDTPITDAFAARYTTWTIRDLHECEEFARDMERVLGQTASALQEADEMLQMTVGMFGGIAREGSPKANIDNALTAFENLKQKYKV